VIKSLHVTNYQSHVDSTLEFHPRINVIVGTSRSGKSALLRALRWVVENKPGGESFRRWDTKSTSVTVDVGDTSVTRAKVGAGGNEYSLVPQGSEGKPYGAGMSFRAFGQTVPEDITRALDMDPTLNFQWQHDKPFLLSDTAGEVARQLNRVANLDVIDVALSTMDSICKKAKRTVEACKGDVSAAQLELDAFAELGSAEELLEDIEGMAGRAHKEGERADSVDAMIDVITKAQQTVAEFKNLDGAAELFAGVEGATTGLLALRLQISTLRQLGSATLAATETIRTSGHVIAAVGAVSKVDALAVELRACRDQLKSLRDISGIIEQSANAVKHDSEREALYTKTLHTLAPGVCPLCGGKGKL